MPPLPEDRCPCEDSTRVPWRAAAALAILSVLGACGGATPAPAEPPASAPPPAVAIAAQLSVPTPVGYDADRQAAFDRLNEIRLSAGLGMLAQDTRLDRAAQAHADWIVANDAFTHDETAGTAGFTGVHWWDRDEALGYVPVGGMEVMAGIVHGAQGVDVLVNGVYHRAGMLAFEPVDVGIGWSSGAAVSISMPLVIDLTKPGTDPVRGLGQGAQPSIGGVAPWPLDGAREVPLRLGLEAPNPVPSQDVASLGTPVSITVAGDQAIIADSFALTEAATGTAVATRLLSAQSDPNALLPGSFVALVPLGALAPGTRYAVAFSGRTLAFPSGASVPVARNWSFTTAAE